MKIARVMVLAMLVGAISIGLSGIARGGETIRVINCADPFHYGLLELVPEFEKETGIKVIMEGYAFETYYTKSTLDCATHTTLYDALAVDCTVTVEYSDAGYLEDLGPFIERDAEEVDAADLVAFGIGEWKGVQYTIPLASYAWILHYRNDLFETYGLKVPRTWDEYYDVAKKLTLDRNGDGKIDFWGTTIEGSLTNPETTQQVWETFLFTHGGRYFRDLAKGDYYPLFDSKEAREATETWYSLFEFSPPESVRYGHFDAIDAVCTDRVGMIGMWGVYASGLYNDPEKSKVVGKVKAATSVIKEGIGIGPTMTGPWLLGINKDSKHKEAAWKYIKWATSPEIQLKLGLGEYMGPARMSVLKDPVLQKKVPVIKSVYEALEAGYWFEPFMPQYKELGTEIIAVRLNEILTGINTLEKGLELMQQDALKLLGFKK